MQELENLRTEFKKTQEKIDKTKLKYNYKDGFADEKDLDKFIQENEDLLQKSFDLREEIERLEWEQLSPKEQEERKEHQRLLDLKAQGKFPL